MVPQTAELHAGRPAGLAARAELDGVPFFPQQDYQCGPAALATALGAAGRTVTPEELVPQVYMPGRQGSLQAEMLAAPRRHGLVSYRLAPRFADLLREVAAGTPVVVLQDYGAAWHYAVVAGYDYGREEVALRSGDKRRLVMPFGVLEYTWKGSDYWAMVVVPPDRIPVTATEAGWLEAVLALERVGDAQTLRTAYATFLRRWPHNLAAAVGLANAHYDLGDLAAAEAVLRRAAADHPDSPVALNNLAQTLSDLGKQGEALALIDRAVALKSPQPAAVGQTRERILRRIENGS